MDEIQRCLTEAKTIAVVGMSPKPDRPSHYVAKCLMERGYRIIPINPAAGEILGMKAYPNLKSVPERIDLVDIFRRSSQVPPIVDDALEAGVRLIWMQDGVRHEESAAKARALGAIVVMDNCMMRELMAREP